MNIESSSLFFDTAHQNFLASASVRGEIKQFYQIAGFIVCFVFVEQTLLELLTPALKHLQREESAYSDLTICVWDSPHGEFPWPPYFLNPRGEVYGYNTELIYTVLDVHTQVLHLFDQQKNLALYWIKNRSQLPWWINGSPFQLIFHWWLRTQGIQMTHAAVIGYPEGGVLLAGKSGSGKSTTSLCCLRAGMRYVSEDYCLLTDGPDVSAHTIYNSAKIGEKTLRWFPELEQHIENPHRAKGEKAFLFHHKFQPEKILFTCPLKALITLKIGEGEKSWLEPIPSEAAIGPLSISTMWQLTHTGPPVFKHFQRVAKALPCYCLHLGSDLEQIPQWIEKTL